MVHSIYIKTGRQLLTRQPTYLLLSPNRRCRSDIYTSYMSPNLWRYHKKSKRRRDTHLAQPTVPTNNGQVRLPSNHASHCEDLMIHRLEKLHWRISTGTHHRLEKPEQTTVRVDTVGSIHNICILTGRLTTLSSLTTGWYILSLHNFYKLFGNSHHRSVIINKMCLRCTTTVPFRPNCRSE